MGIFARLATKFRKLIIGMSFLRWPRKVAGGISPYYFQSTISTQPPKLSSTGTKTKPKNLRNGQYPILITWSYITWENGKNMRHCLRWGQWKWVSLGLEEDRFLFFWCWSWWGIVARRICCILLWRRFVINDFILVNT